MAEKALDTAIATYNTTQGFASTDLDAVPPNVRAGRESQKRQALEELDTRRKEVADALAEVAFGIVVIGDQAKAAEFLRLAKEEADVLAVDAGVMYRRVVDRVRSTMGTAQTFGTSQFGAMILELRQVAKELNVFSMPAPTWAEPVDVGSPEGLYTYIQGLVDRSCGPELVGLYLRNEAAKAAISELETPTKATVPVIVAGMTQAMADQVATKFFRTGRNLLIQLPNEITREFVLETFNKVKQTLKSTKKSSTN